MSDLSESVLIALYWLQQYGTHTTQKELRFKILYIYKKQRLYNCILQQDNNIDIQVDIDWMTNGEMVGGIDQGHKSLPWLIILSFNK